MLVRLLSGTFCLTELDHVLELLTSAHIVERTFRSATELSRLLSSPSGKLLPLSSPI
jgi:hypothetical protein